MNAKILLLLVLSGCAMNVPIHLPDGTIGYNVYCGAPGMNFSHCIEEAGRVCGIKGYQVLSREGDYIPYSIGIYGTNGGFQNSSVMATHNMIIRCYQ